jgi:dTDP-4-dehydrorhamnose 3,5-epimerase
MEFVKTRIPEVILMSPKTYGDDRGFFFETFREDQFRDFGLAPKFVQDNHSGSRQGVLRGLHYQIQHPQGKIVRAVVGEIFDIAVDIRKSSSTFGQWVGEYLTSENKKQLWIPQGFAHGLLVLSDWAEVVYKATDYYSPDFERSIVWDDADIKIDWPLKPGQTPTVSAKDSSGQNLKNADLFD